MGLLCAGVARTYPNFSLFNFLFSYLIFLVVETLLDVFEQVNSLVTLVNEEGKLEFVSPSVERILGYNPVTLVGTYWSQTAMYTEFPKHPASSSVEKEVIDAQGNIRNIIWSNSMLADGKHLFIGQDITTMKAQTQRLTEFNQELHLKQRDFSDSVEYAQRIQHAILPNSERLSHLFDSAFVLYKPKDVVSGDFYWFTETEEHIFVTAGDCTGHGIPGAMLTVLAVNLLREIVQKRGVHDPGQALNLLDQEVIITLSDENGHYKAKDGLDLALVKIHKQTLVMEYAAAFRPVALVRNGQYTELKGERYPIGFFDHLEKNFTTREEQLEQGDAIYLFSDGYVDQFGGDRDKKFSKAKFRNLIESIQDMDMDEQGGFLEYAFRNWKQENPQTDDVVVVGFRV
jgi:PAS domain S-box-containing protein